MYISSLMDQSLTSKNQEKIWTLPWKYAIWERLQSNIFKFCLIWLITYEDVTKKKDIFKECFTASPLSKQMNYETLFKDFFSDVLKCMKDYYLYRQNWEVTAISTSIIS